MALLKCRIHASKKERGWKIYIHNLYCKIHNILQHDDIVCKRRDNSNERVLVRREKLFCMCRRRLLRTLLRCVWKLYTYLQELKSQEGSFMKKNKVSHFIIISTAVPKPLTMDDNKQSSGDFRNREDETRMVDWINEQIYFKNTIRYE